MNLDYNRKSGDLSVLVLGYIIRGPLGGMTWHHLQYVLGMKELGFEVYYLEDSGDTPYCCYDPVRGVTDEDPSYGLQFASKVMSRVGLSKNWAYYNKHGNKWEGPLADRIMGIISRCCLLVNLSCSNTLRPWLQNVPVRALVDTDPVFTQIRNLVDPERKKLSDFHNAFFSFGENIGSADNAIPDDGINWRPTRQPVVLSAWPVTEGSANGNFTTVMQWESYPSREYQSRWYGVKADSFKTYFDLPQRTHSTLEIALGSESAPRQKFKERGWILRDPMTVGQDPWTYQEYIKDSKAEFSIAKHAYVEGNTGWFSERSTAYLASGRPVVVQDTGFSKFIETGKGILSFQSPEEALEGIKSVNKNYRKHCMAARILAEEYFNSTMVLTMLIENAFNMIK
jgi:hypothetical protein